MRNFLRPAAWIACLAALACAGCSSDGTGPPGDAGSSTPSGAGASPSTAAAAGTSYAPYVSATTASANDSAGSPSAYNLAFVISDGSGCTPQWDGSQAIDDPAVKSRISAPTSSGSSVRVSFGGASGTELAAVCPDAPALADAYADALDAAGATQADFDIEGDDLDDPDAVAMHSKAIALLQKERTDVTVSFTLPVMPSGLDEDGLALLRSAHDNGVKVATVNIMTMNYGDTYTGDMGDYAITSARAAHDQLQDVFGLSSYDAWRGLAVTSMIGDNDIAGETFTLSDAARVRSFAEDNGIAWVSMWSTFRDRQCEGGGTSSDDAATNCSGVPQSTGAFAQAFSG
ncbi:chitinase [Streptomyces sp. NBC_00249]|uniref:chitinase n=1 Tax=Streptomyces sp. NBC_00249 TaxID=2975690 RepID=UPI00224CB7B9|nr:chitinase [Streptomyces sp. NBC_00249]MCX5192365.1 chitinase [Streptomyces sp. NBC_00249]